jgi:nucleoside-diphosphate-sugar epimerase
VNRVLVTGATGFIGRHALAPLVERGFDVHAASRAELREGGGVTWHEADLLQDGAAASLVASVRPTHLLHLAWCTEYGVYWSSPENLAWLARSLDLIRAFREAGGRRAVVAGTCAEYDWRGDICSADAPLAPTTMYGASKNALRQVLERYAAVTGLSVAWGRIYFPFGPGEQPCRVVAAAARGIVEGKRVGFSSGRQVRDFLYVDDVAEAFAALVAAVAEGTFDVGSGTGVALGDLLQQLERLAGTSGLVVIGARPDRDEPTRIVAETTRMARDVGWSPRVPLDEGLRRTLDWWRVRSERPLA